MRGCGALFSAYRSLTQLLVVAGEVRGRKKLQKIVYIAQELGYPFPEPFDLHIWGPYSEILTVKLKEMTDWGFARETALPGPAGNQQYVYAPGPNADRALAEPDHGEEHGEGFGALVRHLNAQEATFLEGVATVIYLREKGKPDDEVRAMLTRLKPDKFADPDRVHAVMAFADRLEGYRAS